MFIFRNCLKNLEFFYLIFQFFVFFVDIILLCHVYRVSRTTRISRISQKLSAADKNISDKSCKVSSNALHGDISMTLKSVVKVT